jgi:hypothetical protein
MIGVQYFSLAAAPPESCAADYATPDVEIARDNATTIDQSLARRVPEFGRPTGPALLGAHTHMAKFRPIEETYGRMLFVVLVTNGNPTECQPATLAELEAMAQAAASRTPQVATYVIALGSLASEIVQVGAGEPSWYSIPGGNVADAVRSALLRVRFHPNQFACQGFDVPLLPNGQRIDPNRVVVEIDSAISGDSRVARVSSAAECAKNGGKGWYFSAADSRTTLELCQGTCDDMTGQIRISFGCLP